MQDTPLKIRSPQQNKSIHKYFEEVAQELNFAGITMKALVENIEVDHTKESIKSIWRAIGKAKYGKESSATWSTSELQGIYEEFNRLVSKFGIHLPFPSIESSHNYLESLSKHSQ